MELEALTVQKPLHVGGVQTDPGIWVRRPECARTYRDPVSEEQAMELGDELLAGVSKLGFCGCFSKLGHILF